MLGRLHSHSVLGFLEGGGINWVRDFGTPMAGASPGLSLLSGGSRGWGWAGRASRRSTASGSREGSYLMSEQRRRWREAPGQTEQSGSWRWGPSRGTRKTLARVHRARTWTPMAVLTAASQATILSMTLRRGNSFWREVPGTRKEEGSPGSPGLGRDEPCRAWWS